MEPGRRVLCARPLAWLLSIALCSSACGFYAQSSEPDPTGPGTISESPLSAAYGCDAELDGILSDCQRRLLSNAADGLQASRNAIRIARSEGRPDYTSIAMLYEAHGLMAIAGYPAATKKLEQARALLPENAHPTCQAYFALLEAELHYMGDRFLRATLRMRDAFALAEGTDSFLVPARCLVLLHDLEQVHELTIPQVDDLLEARQLLEACAARDCALGVQLRMVSHALDTGDDAETQLLRLAEIEAAAEARQNRSVLLRAGLIRFYRLSHMEKWKDLEPLATKMVTISRDMENLEYLAKSLSRLAWVHLETGRPDQAAALLAEASQLAEKFDAPFLKREVWGIEAQLALERGQADVHLEFSTRMESIYDGGEGADSPEERARAAETLEEVLSMRRAQITANKLRIAAAAQSAAEEQSKRLMLQWGAAGLALLLLTTLSGVLFFGQRRARQMHAQLKEQGERSARNEEARRRLEQHVLQLERLDSLGQLSASVAHDFNNILCTISGHAELLRVGTGIESNDSLDAIAQAALRASDLCSRLLDQSKPRIENLQTLDLGEIVRSASYLESYGGEMSANTTVEVEGDAIFAEIDEVGFERVLVNLVSNAHESGVGASNVHVRVFASNDLPPGETGGQWFGTPPVGPHYSVLEVRDDGCGIPPDLLRRIFDPFFTTRFEGRGLGLSGAYGLVTAQKGAIHVSSTVGEGSTFSVYFPAAICPIVADPVAPAAQITKDPVQPSRLLVVDDELSILQFLQASLSVCGHAVEVASTGADALALLQSPDQSVDLVIMDLSMPGMGGDQLLSRIRSIAADLPVVVMSGHNKAVVEDRLGDLGYEGLLRKPFRIGELSKAIGTALDTGSRHGSRSTAS